MVIEKTFVHSTDKKKDRNRGIRNSNAVYNTKQKLSYSGDVIRSKGPVRKDFMLERTGGTTSRVTARAMDARRDMKHGKNS